MNRNQGRRWLIRLIVAAGAALAVAGCSQPPLSPLSAPQGSAFPTGSPPSSAMETYTSSTSASMDGSWGGRLSTGRFTVTIPRGAYSGTATITMRMNSRAPQVVDLSITPGNLNNFKTPVTLTFNPTGLGITEPVTIYYYDPVTKKWVDLGARPDSRGLPAVYLSHFSIYGAGKAGW